MANLSNTSPWIQAGQGLTQAIQNVGAIQDIQRSNEQAQRTGVIQNMQIQESQRLNRPVDVDELLAPFKGREMSKQVMLDYLTPYMQKDPSGKIFIRQGDIPEALKPMNTPQGRKDAALAGLADIGTKLEALQPPKDANGQPIIENPMDKTLREQQIKQLTNKKRNLEKMYEKVTGKITPMMGPDNVIQWVDEEKNFIPEFKGMKPVSATAQRPTVVAPGGVVLGPDNQPVFTNPAKEPNPVRPTVVAPGGVVLGPDNKPVYTNPARPRTEKEPGSIDLKRLGDMITTATQDGKEPTANEIELIKTEAAKSGYDFEKFTGKSAVYGIPGTNLNWGGNETSEWRLVPKSATGRPAKVSGGTKKLLGTKNGKPVYDVGNGEWQVGD
jgi:cell fate (sporulation/competence/biofilm development) regulator YlbF (YheA/YmcA/DUF963 family)